MPERILKVSQEFSLKKIKTLKFQIKDLMGSYIIFTSGIFIETAMLLDVDM